MKKQYLTENARIALAYEKKNILESIRALKNRLNEINEGAFSRQIDELDERLPILYFSEDDYDTYGGIEELKKQHPFSASPDWYDVKNRKNSKLIDINGEYRYKNGPYSYNYNLAFPAVLSDDYSHGCYIGVIVNNFTSDEFLDRSDLDKWLSILSSFINKLHENYGGEVVSKNPNFSDRWIRPHLKNGESPIQGTRDADMLSMGHYDSAREYFKNVYGDDHPLA